MNKFLFESLAGERKDEIEDYKNLERYKKNR